MNPILFLSILSSHFFSPPPDPPLIPNPASAYAAFLGYKSETRHNAAGEYGVVVFPDGSECEEWQFFRGTCGEKFSYCTKKGCETHSVTEDQGGYTIEYCACGCIDQAGNKTTIPLMEFMEQHGDTLIKPQRGGLFR